MTRRLFIIAILVLSGCAGTDYPLFVSPSRADATDQASRKFIKALAAHDRQAVIAATADSAQQADQDIAQAPILLHPAQPRYLFDMLMEEHYARQYAVALAGGGEIEIRCWFDYSQDSLVRSYQVLPRVR